MGDYAQIALMAVKTIQSSQQAKAQQSAVMAEQRADIQQRQYQLQIQEREKRARLKRAEATQRSRFGAQGMNSNGGSAAALLSGLRKETDQSIADMRGQENMRVNELNAQAKRQERISLLELQNGTFNQGLGSIFNLLEK